MGLFGFGKPKDEVLEAKIANLKSQIEQEKKELEKIKERHAIAKEYEITLGDIENKRHELKTITEEIALANDDLGLQEFGFFERQYKFSNSTQYKEKLDKLRDEAKTKVKDGRAGVILQEMLLDNSISKGRAMQNQLIKAAIRGFNGEADALLTKVTVSNVENKIKALRKAYEQINKLYSRNQVKLTSSYLDLKIEELRLMAEYELQKQEEKDLLREQREKEREDKKLQAEIAKQRKQITKDKTHFQQIIDNVKQMMIEADAENLTMLKLQLQEYENKLSELEELEENIDYREGHASAGYVYVISNIGSFGEDIYKIGVTRRLEPLERIRELGSASVPFQFDVHALVFSENAFALETELHNEFNAYKVNKLNSRKEYFNVPFTKIKEVLERHKELTIELTETAEAFEYRQGKLKEND